MADSITDLDNLPEIDFLGDMGISLGAIQEDMVTDYQDEYLEVTGKEAALYPGNPVRLMLNVVAGQIFQAYKFMEYTFKQNFIKYMDETVLKNWGATIGFAGSSLKAAVCTLEFGINSALGFDVHIPAGTKATAGDDIYFSSDNSCVIKAGETSVQVKATCTQEGTAGNSYMPGQINVLAEPVLNIGTVKNTDISAGGRDDYTLEERRALTYMFPSAYSVAGPEDAYIFWTKKFSEDIVSVNIITDNATATVIIYIMLSGGNVPDEDYCAKVLDYLKGLKTFPDTDKVIVCPPETVSYNFKAKYYISSENRDTESTIIKSVNEAARDFISINHENMGYDINPDIFTEYARVAGAKRVETTSPVYTKINPGQVAVCTGFSLEYCGMEDT